MIAHLEGKVISVSQNAIIVNVQGVGFDVYSAVAPYKVGDTISLYTYLHWHQENGPQLFGFSSLNEKIVFLEVIKCQGIGPKLAMTILSHLGIGPLLEGLVQGNINLLSSVSGVGKKKAEQMVLQLKDKIPDLISNGIGIEQTGSMHWKELHEALNALNYSRTEIQEALDYVRSQVDQSATFDLLMRKALTFLSKRK